MVVQGYNAGKRERSFDAPLAEVGRSRRGMTVTGSRTCRSIKEFNTATSGRVHEPQSRPEICQSRAAGIERRN